MKERSNPIERERSGAMKPKNRERITFYRKNQGKIVLFLIHGPKVKSEGSDQSTGRGEGNRILRPAKELLILSSLLTLFNLVYQWQEKEKEPNQKPITLFQSERRET